jgi:hypothetical protein
MNKTHPKILLVEGQQELRTIPELMEANGIDWGTRNNPVVYIRDCKGYGNLVDSEAISTELKASKLSALGIIVDADDRPLERWQSLRNACLSSIPDLPKNPPEEGIIYTTPANIKFGVWLMPDNKMCGMLETFLTYLIPDGNNELWELAKETAKHAKSQGASFKEPHFDKANIYTWLAWQNPPGRQLHQAIMERILDPNHPNSVKFVNWFKNLYDL